MPCALEGIVPAIDGPNYRTARAINQYAKQVRKECARLKGIIKQVWSSSLTGDPTDEQVLKFATAVYKEKGKFI